MTLSLSPPPKNIIVRMPNWLGDAVMATPILTMLRESFPEAKITAMCQGGVSALLKYNPHINNIFSFQRPSGWLHRIHHPDIISTLRKGNYDLGVLLTNSFSSACFFWRGNVKNTIGFEGNFRSKLLDKPIPFPKNKETQHLVNTYKHLLSPLRISLNNTPPQLFIDEKEISEAKGLLKKFNISDQHILIGINPGAAYGSAKCWPPNNFKELTIQLLKNPLVKIIYFGDLTGASLVKNIFRGMPDRVTSLAGKTSIRQLMSLIKICNVFLTNDSGPMHIAAALKTPHLALFGSTSPVKTGPYESDNLIYKNVECSPCYKRTCPIDFPCMKEITTEEVYKRIQLMIQEV